LRKRNSHGRTKKRVSPDKTTTRTTGTFEGENRKSPKSDISEEKDIPARRRPTQRAPKSEVRTRQRKLLRRGRQINSLLMRLVRDREKEGHLSPGGD